MTLATSSASPPPVSANPPSSADRDVFVETQYATLFDGSEPLRLQSGESLGPVTVAYETYGQLSPDRDNAIFICHALTGDAHVAGRRNATDRKPGWWDEFIGPGKGLDTNRYFVICANVLGGCQGTTGPSSAAPGSDRPYGLKFPFITIGDMVEVHAALVRRLGIPKLLAVAGGSLGGMQVLEWAARYPGSLHAAICLASSARLSAQGIAFNAVGRRAIYADPNFQNGDYYGDCPNQFGEAGPVFGLALARMIAHITYLSEASIETKFGRKLQNADQLAYELQRETEFQIESYLHYQGQRFVERFDANSYLYLTRAMDYFDLASRHGSIAEALSATDARFLITSYTSDWLFTTAQSEELVQSLISRRKRVTFLELPSQKGHDAFLLEVDPLRRLVTPFLAHLHRSITGAAVDPEAWRRRDGVSRPLIEGAV